MLRPTLTSWAQPLYDEPCDVLVVGGGATGLGVALQAALEGRRVALVEGRDFASGTSSRSTKLLHGGVRYLAQGRIGLVREALRERAIVLDLAPHLAAPLPFVVAEPRRLPWATTALGLKLYQWLAGGLSLGPTQRLDAATVHALAPTLPPGLWGLGGVRYWDGQFEDARLALALARTAAASGASLRNHTRLVDLQRVAETGRTVPAGSTAKSGLWLATLTDPLRGAHATLRARCVVNATGVWVDELRALALRPRPAPLVQASQGAHLVVSRSTLPLNAAVLVPHTRDGRVLFAIPWLGATVIGTTDTPREDAPAEPRPFDEELHFLFAETERALGVRLKPEDVRSVWAGLRPLVGATSAADGKHPPGPTSALSREHFIVREAPGLLTVTGGKWTTYRAMAADVLRIMAQSGDLPPPPRPVDTRHHRLWGAILPGPAPLQAPPGLHLLGGAAPEVLALPGHDQPLGLGLTEAVVRYAARHEWAITVEDVLARRWRTLFLDARAAQNVAPRVAALLQTETGLDPQLDAFLTLSQHYQLPQTFLETFA